MHTEHMIVCLATAQLSAEVGYNVGLRLRFTGGGMAVAWIYFVKQKGLSPLMPGQWKAFLAYYAGMLWSHPES